METIESEEAVEKGEPKSDMDTSSSAQCTSFLGVMAMVDDRREIEREIEYILISTARRDHVQVEVVTVTVTFGA